MSNYMYCFITNFFFHLAIGCGLFSGEYIQICFYWLCVSIVRIYHKLFNYTPTDGTLKEMTSTKECYIFMPLSNDFIGINS